MAGGTARLLLALKRPSNAAAPLLLAGRCRSRAPLSPWRGAVAAAAADRSGFAARSQPGAAGRRHPDRHHGRHSRAAVRRRLDARSPPAPGRRRAAAASRRRCPARWRRWSASGSSCRPISKTRLGASGGDLDGGQLARRPDAGLPAGRPHGAGRLLSRRRFHRRRGRWAPARRVMPPRLSLLADRCMTQTRRHW